MKRINPFSLTKLFGLLEHYEIHEATREKPSAQLFIKKGIFGHGSPIDLDDYQFEKSGLWNIKARSRYNNDEIIIVGVWWQSHLLRQIEKAKKPETNLLVGDKKLELSDQVIMVPVMDIRLHSIYIRDKSHGRKHNDVLAGSIIGGYNDYSSWYKRYFSSSTIDLTIPISGRIIKEGLDDSTRYRETFFKNYCLVIIPSKDQTIPNNLMYKLYEPYIHAIREGGRQRKYILANVNKDYYINNDIYSQDELSDDTINALIEKAYSQKHETISFEDYCLLFRKEMKRDFPIEESYSYWYEESQMFARGWHG